MSYIVDRVGFTVGEDKDPLDFQLQGYLNHKHDHSKPWELVNVVSIESLYSSSQDLTAGKVSGINVTMIWRTHK